MRASLLTLTALALLAAPGCANPGRTRDARVGPSPDVGTRDAGMQPDMGGAPDMGAPRDTGMMVTPDMGMMVTPDMGGIVRPDAFVPDMGSGAPDTGPRPDTGCSSDTQCSDGIGCNGAERCVAGACLPAVSPLDCNDSLACTTDTCVEPGTCSHVSTCAGGAACMASGCASCSDSPCRLLSPQCGCATGQACYPQGATRVCATSGAGTTGALCTSNSSCAASYACLNVAESGTPTSLCTHVCASDADCGGGLCIIRLDDGTGAAVPGLTLCTHPCNAATNLGCAAGTTCTFFSETAGAMRTFTDCTAPTTGTGEDMSCVTTAPTCSPDRYCVDTGDGLGPACHHWCNTATGAGCTIGHSCLSFSTPIVVNGVTYGVCST